MLTCTSMVFYLNIIKPKYPLLVLTEAAAKGMRNLIYDLIYEMIL